MHMTARYWGKISIVQFFHAASLLLHPVATDYQMVLQAGKVGND
jgi:hypothetical protein